MSLHCRARERTKLGDPAGLTQFGVNLLRLTQGAWSSQRHWHTDGTLMQTQPGAQRVYIERSIGKRAENADFDRAQQDFGRPETNCQPHDPIVRDMVRHPAALPLIR
jgi:hypothetical protein